MNAEIFGKPDCIHCEKAKFLCKQKGIDYSYQELGKDFEMGLMLEKFPGAKTFPQIIVNGKHIGGYDDLSVLFEQKNNQ